MCGNATKFRSYNWACQASIVSVPFLKIIFIWSFSVVEITTATYIGFDFVEILIVGKLILSYTFGALIVHSSLIGPCRLIAIIFVCLCAFENNSDFWGIAGGHWCIFIANELHINTRPHLIDSVEKQGCNFPFNWRESWIYWYVMTFNCVQSRICACLRIILCLFLC